MRSFKLFGVKNGGPEVYIDTISDPTAGKVIRDRLAAEKQFDYLRCRDCLGGQIRNKSSDRQENSLNRSILSPFQGLFFAPCLGITYPRSFVICALNAFVCVFTHVFMCIYTCNQQINRSRGQ